MRLLSYPIGESTPVYGGGPGPEIVPEKKISEGDSCNTLRLEFSNHTGTHIDLPFHFDDEGKTLTDYDSDFWFARSVYVCILPEEPVSGALIGPDILEPELANCPADVEALLLKTGYCHRRAEEVYWKSSPGIHADMAEFLTRRFPDLRFFGFDLLSITSYAHREHGRFAHRSFLKTQRPILPIEDMDLRNLPPEGVSNLLVSPLYLEKADGAPCSVWVNVRVNS